MRTMQPAPEGFKLTPVSYATLLLLAIAWPVLSFYFLNSQLELTKDVTDPVTELYYPTIIVQLTTLLLVLIAVKLEKVNLTDLGLHRFTRWTLLQAVVFMIAANLFLSLVQLFILAQSPESFTEIAGILPRTGFAQGIWVILCAIVALCEEIVFRGYILSRIARLAGGRVWLGVLVATVAFASGHLYQGLGGFVVVFIYGLMFAGLYLHTGSLFPGIIAHFLQDALVLFVPHWTR